MVKYHAIDLKPLWMPNRITKKITPRLIMANLLKIKDKKNFLKVFREKDTLL